MNNTRLLSRLSISLWLLALFTLVSSQAVAAPLCYTDARTAYHALTVQNTQQQKRIDNQSVNINRASEAELTTLQGIGSSKARAIILYREMFGGFATPKDITKVKGIGAATFEKNRARIRVTD